MAGLASSQLRWARRVIALAAPLVPADLRADWRREWHAELESAGPSARGLVRHALGAFADAFWLRQRHVADFDWIDDLRHGCRQMAAHRGFAVTVIGILAVGIAASVTAFSVVSQILLRPLPYPDPDRIVTVWERRSSEPGRFDVAPGNFLDWRDRATAFSHLAGAEPFSLDYTSEARPEVWRSANVTPGFFESFGLHPQLGRLFLDEEYARGRHRVVLLSAPLWRSTFASDPAIVGRTVTLDAEPYEIVGVLSDDFAPVLLEDVPGTRVAWTPKIIEEYEPRIRAGGYWQVVGRLAPARALDDAQAEMDTIAAQLEAEHPRTNTGARAVVVPLREHLVGDTREAVLLFAAAVLLVLLIACVNVTNLLLARGAARQQELVVRTALGASRRRLIAQLLLESLLLATLASIAGVLLAHGATRAIAMLGPPELPWVETLHVDVAALAFAAGLAIVVALLAGLVPAYRLASTGMHAGGLRTTTADRRQRRLRASLVAAEIALALVLVSGSALLLRSFVNLLQVDTGFRQDGVLVLQVFAWDRNPEADRLAQFFDEALARLEALPGVERAGAVSAMPFIETNIDIRATFAIAGRPPTSDADAPRASLTVASDGYFEVLGVPVLDGRGFRRTDERDRPGVAVVSEALATRYWPGGSPISDRVAFRLQGQVREVEVVGVVGAVRHERLDEAPRGEIFVPLSQVPFGSMTMVARTTVPPVSLLEAAKAEVWGVDPLQTFYRTATLDELVGRHFTARRFALVVLAGFAAVALLLAAAGVYGVLSAIAAQQRREYGVRLALGASWSDIIRLVVARGAAIVGTGLAIGVAGTLGASRLLEGFLVDTAPSDPSSLSAAAALLVLVALPACYLPARRAASADPTEVLRSE